MKTIIAGSRDIIDFAIICEAVKRSGFEITEVCSGTARGPDALGERWAYEHNVHISLFPAPWNTKGYFDRGAGFKRNKAMAEYADALIAIWDGQSKGTKNMIKWATHYKLPISIYYMEGYGG